MDYLDILKRAAKITWRAKYLWVFGLLAGTGSGFNFNSFNWSGDGAESVSGEEAALKARDFFTDNTVWIIAIVGVLLVIGLAFFVLSVMARGGLIHSVSSIEDGKSTGFKDSLKAGAKKFWPILGTALAYGLVMMFALVVLGVPVGLLFYYQMTVRAVILLLFALAIYIPLAFVLSFVVNWSMQYIVVKDQSMVKSWSLGFVLFRHNLGSNLIMWLLLMLAGFLSGIMFMLALVMISLPFVVLGLMAFAVLQWAGVAAIAAAGLVLLFLLSLFYGAIFSTFQSATWTLMFKELVKPQPKNS